MNPRLRGAFGSSVSVLSLVTHQSKALSYTVEFSHGRRSFYLLASGGRRWLSWESQITLSLRREEPKPSGICCLPVQLCIPFGSQSLCQDIKGPVLFSQGLFASDNLQCLPKQKASFKVTCRVLPQGLSVRSFLPLFYLASSRLAPQKGSGINDH